jgi:hypothetical protein
MPRPSKPAPLSAPSAAVLIVLGVFEAFALLAGMGQGMAEGDDLSRDAPLLGSLFVALATLGVACTARINKRQALAVVLVGSSMAVVLAYWTLA